MCKLDDKNFCNEKFILKIIDNVLKPLFDGNFQPLSDSKQQAEDDVNLYPNVLNQRYEDMRNNLNSENHKKEAYIEGNLSVKKDKLCVEGKIAVGLDLPVLIGNPNADNRIMVISQDPRRNEDEMDFPTNKGHDCCALSTPFGWHNEDWREKKSNLVTQIFSDILKEIDYSKYCFYFTDFYKFTKVNIKGQPHIIDNINEDTYKISLDNEIEQLLGKGSCYIKIITLGKKVSDILCPKDYNYKKKNFLIESCNGTYNNIGVLILPHPSGANSHIKYNGKKFETFKNAIMDFIKSK
jgi:uracil-DNA glycosylase